MEKRFDQEACLSLWEILLIVGLIVIIAAIGTPGFVNHQSKAGRQMNVCINNLRALDARHKRVGIGTRQNEHRHAGTGMI